VSKSIFYDPAKSPPLLLKMLPSSNNPKKNKIKRRFQHSDLFQPSIYRYTCRGAYFASSEKIGSEGTCRGLRSRLELLSDMDLATREAAIKNFTYMTDFEMDDADASDLNQQTKSILVSPALVYRDTNSDGKKKESLPEEEIIKRQQWSCYGSTEVEYLILRHPKTGEEKIAAIAPRNVGVSIRKIESDEGSITSMAIGWLNIVVDSGPPMDSEQSDTDEQDARLPVDEVAPRPPADSIAAAKATVGKVYTFGGKLLDQMSSNAIWLYGNMQDDFPSRTYAAGAKIVDQFPKTIDRTTRFMGKMLGSLWDNDDDRDD